MFNYFNFHFDFGAEIEKDVLIIGDGISGSDIAEKLLETANSVTLSARRRLPFGYYN